MEVTISENTANVLLLVCQQTNASSGQDKIALGMAQTELEQRLAAVRAEAANAPPEAAEAADQEPL